MDRPRSRPSGTGAPGSAGWTQAIATLWIVSVACSALLAAVLPLADPLAMDLTAPSSPPGRLHLLGTDPLGRDILSRVLYGARASLTVGLFAPALGLLVGGIAGLAAGYYRGRVEASIMIVIDTLLAFPGIVLALALAAVLGPGLFNLVLTLGVVSVPAFARVSRAHTLSVAERDFVLAARALGFGPARIVLRHVLPNVLPHLLSLALVVVAVMIVAEGALSFLGLGIAPPQPSWGSLIADGRDYLEESPHISLVPAAVLSLTVLSLTVLADSVRTRAGP